MEPRRIRVLLVGPLPPPIGGTTLLFERLVESLRSGTDVDPVIVETGGVRGRGLFAASAFSTLHRELLQAFRGCDVATLHVSTTALHMLGPVVASIATRNHVPLIVRKFGGTDFFDFDVLRRQMILRTLRSAKLYLAETKALVDAARDGGVENAEWFPNARPMPALPEDVDRGHERCTRFVYLGQVHRRKGIPELIAASEALESGDVDVYGTLGFDVPESELSGHRSLHYRGAVEPDRVHETLAGYDALVLPSYHAGEGYPGVILEAFGAGLPVVTTRWRALPELVDETCGVLVPPRDAYALASAMNELVGDDVRYRRLRQGVLDRRALFDERRWHEQFVSWCRRLARTNTEEDA